LGWCFFKGPDGNIYALQEDAANEGEGPSAWREPGSGVEVVIESRWS
jgi:hypothetical protein